MIKVSAPGKICIAGEWAVLEKGNPLIVAAVEKRVFVKIKKSRDEFIHISIRDFAIKDLKAQFFKNKLVFKRKLTKKERNEILFLKIAIESAKKYFLNIEPFEIETWGKETTKKVKGKKESIGFGSSASSVVAVIGCIFKFCGKDIKRAKIKEKIYKLSAIVHYLAQGKVGSGFDIAASTFGGIFVYKRFDSEWLIRQFKKNKDIARVVNKEWPGFSNKPLSIPKDFNLLVGWTGKSSLTAKMIKELKKWKKDNVFEYQNIIKSIKKLVEQLIIAWEKEDREKILELIRKNEIYLRELGKISGINIETDALFKLSQVANQMGGAGKLSGSGGGDCGIAITFKKGDSRKIKKEWKKNKIQFINTKLSFSGIKEES